MFCKTENFKDNIRTSFVFIISKQIFEGYSFEGMYKVRIFFLFVFLGIAFLKGLTQECLLCFVFHILQFSISEKTCRIKVLFVLPSAIQS